MAATRTAIEFSSADGTLTLHAEAWGAEDAPLTALCLHGLTRNGADFGALVEHLAPRYRVITADQRGRGKSQWDPIAANYQPAVYVRDMFHLLDRLKIARAVLIGTSMGGIMSMLMAATQPLRIRGMVLNDIGPEVPNVGLKRLRDSLNAASHIETWQDAARDAKRRNGLAFPDYGDSDWDAFARRTFAGDPSGRPIAAYDRAILNGLNEADLSAAPANLWPLWAQLSSTPTMAIRGELSDILSAETFARMAATHPNLIAVTVPNRGHAPMLDEPMALSAIDAFLDALKP
jgi:pimeloyl-ACP methyl ester carboxylesterase